MIGGFLPGKWISGLPTRSGVAQAIGQLGYYLASSPFTITERANEQASFSGYDTVRHCPFLRLPILVVICDTLWTQIRTVEEKSTNKQSLKCMNKVFRWQVERNIVSYFVLK